MPDSIPVPPRAKDFAAEAAEVLQRFSVSGKALCLDLGTKELKFKAGNFTFTVSDTGHVVAFN